MFDVLVSAGYQVIAPDYRGLDLETASDMIMYQLLDDAEHRQLLVGHSFGGAVALLAARQAVKRGAVLAGLVLCAPAVFLAEALVKPERLPCPAAPAIILHGVRDTLIPIELSRGFGREHDLTLIEANDDHALLGSLDVIAEAVAALEADRPWVNGMSGATGDT
jgi:pimeloyl-ACP methyl ester carboxylesterase